MIYKVGKLDLSLISQCCEARFSRTGVTEGAGTGRRIQYTTVFLMLCQLLLSGFTSLVEGAFYDDLGPGYDKDDVIIHCRTVSLPLATA